MRSVRVHPAVQRLPAAGLQQGGGGPQREAGVQPQGCAGRAQGAVCEGHPVDGLGRHPVSARHRLVAHPAQTLLKVSPLIME